MVTKKELQDIRKGKKVCEHLLVQKRCFCVHCFKEFDQIVIGRKHNIVENK